MTSKPKVPLITASDAAEMIKPDFTVGQHARLVAIADGKATTVEVMGEEELRAEFEAIISGPPYEHMCDRRGAKSAWPGHYKRYETQLAFDVALDLARAKGIVR
ncbi:hypothetical protein [Panacagrimonas sp.]|uniref:hypothetical protein n=1 Tax=Panacagrimonas sp. TaxID=2480088 RepID=UPI003B52D558